MRLTLAIALPLLVGSAAAQTLSLDNGVLRVDLDQNTGALKVTDLGTGATFSQPASIRDPLETAQEDAIVVFPAPEGIALDGSLADWSGARAYGLPTYLDANGNPREARTNDLEAAVAFMWDSEWVYAAFVVADDDFRPGDRSDKEWRKHDAVSWWGGWDEAGIMVSPADAGGFLWGEWKDWSQAKARQFADLGADADAVALAGKAGIGVRGRAGYVVESRTSAGSFIAINPPSGGRRFRIAAVVYDTDDAGPEGCACLPASYRSARTVTYAAGVLVDAGASAPTIPNTGPPPCRDAAKSGDTLTYTTTADLPEATVGSVRCTVRLPEEARHIEVECTPVDAWEWGVPIFRGFIPDEGPSEYVVPYYGDGILVPTDDLAPPIEYLGSFSSLDMPGYGVSGQTGSALCILETYDYMISTLRPGRWADRTALASCAMAERAELDHPDTYRLQWHFTKEGGYLPLAPVMRSFCESQGWVRTLREKREKNPREDRLMGAPDVWGSNGLAFAREAKRAGVRRMLVSGAYSPEQIAGIEDLGYLVGEYDQYVDTDPDTEPLNGVAPYPGQVRVERNGELAKGWLTLDGKHQYFSRCSNFALPAAQQKVTRTLETHPYNARFLDVHTAMGLAECYSREHPCDHTQDRENKTQMLQWIRDQGLMIGGEHGRAWSAGVLDYQEGMMSGNTFFTWPAGHLVKIEREDQIGPAYHEWGLNPARRVPFWELTFHDCVVSTWYWGDSVDYFESVRPDLTDRKVAFTALYGTVPLFWDSDLGFGFTGKGKERFLQAYRNCAKIHEAVGYERMVNHEFITPDRAVQRTTFSDGTTVTVNFGELGADVRSGGELWALGTNGIVADGPGIHQHVALLGGRLETYIERPGYRFLDGHGRLAERGGLASSGPVTVEAIGDGRALVCVEPETRRAAVEPSFLPGWDRASARLLDVRDDLEPMRDVAVKWDGDRLVLPVSGGWQTWELAWGPATASADLGIRTAPTALSAEQGDKLTLDVTVHNLGGARGAAMLRAYWDAAALDRLAADQRCEVPARGSVTVRLSVPTDNVDGPRALMLALDSGTRELIAADNAASVPVTIRPDLEQWAVRIPARVEIGPVDREGPVVEGDMDLAAHGLTDRIDPMAVRVALVGADGAPGELVPAQFEPGDAPGKGTLAFILPGRHGAGETVPVCVLARATGMGLLAPVGGHVDEKARKVLWPSYEANLGTGAVRPLTYKPSDGPPQEMLSRVIFSSAETGWGEDEGTLETFRVLADGPVRTRILTVVKLPSDVTVTRTYSFYADRFTIDASATKLCAGLFSRVWYGAHGEYEDDTGRTTTIDGQGRDEGITDAPSATHWYSMRSEKWAHACIGLSEFAGQAYWDEGSSLGQLGFQSVHPEGNVYAQIISGPQPSPDFARRWYAALASPARLVAGE